MNSHKLQDAIKDARKRACLINSEYGRLVLLIGVRDNLAEQKVASHAVMGAIQLAIDIELEIFEKRFGFAWDSTTHAVIEDKTDRTLL